MRGDAGVVVAAGGSRPPSFIKWTGGKRALARRIAAEAPARRRYFEPFLGGGAVLFHLARPGDLASDAYAPLIALWTLARDAPGELASDYARRWGALQAEGPAVFYRARAAFNAAPDPFALNFLLRTCVNGIVRFNSRGEFNNSFHLTRPGARPERFARALEAWSDRVQGVRFAVCDYREALAAAGAGDFAYLDPPYANSRHRYAEGADPDGLFEALEGLNRRGVLWALSFDGRRGERVYEGGPPRRLYRRLIPLEADHSAVSRVLNGPLERVCESLYLNF